MFLNLTNHPAERWDEKQKTAAQAYGEIVDFPFPAVDPEMDERGLAKLAASLAETVCGMEPDAVLLQGEMGLTYCLTHALLRCGVTVLHATSRREAVERVLPDGTTEKTARFAFCRFRAYAEI